MSKPKLWYYYLHENGSIIGKPPTVVESDPNYFESSFVKKFWKIDEEDGRSLWDMVLDCSELEADTGQILTLIRKWRLDRESANKAGVRIQWNDKGLPRRMK